MCLGFYVAGVIVAGSRTNEIFIENGRFHGNTDRRRSQNQVATGIADKRKQRSVISVARPGKSFRTLITDRWLVTFYLAAGPILRP